MNQSKLNFQAHFLILTDKSAMARRGKSPFWEWVISCRIAPLIFTMNLIVPLVLNTPQVILFILGLAVVFFIGYYIGKEIGASERMYKTPHSPDKG
ncbi:MAG: hypothetical protein WBV47_01710 [Salegentibacter sp.]